MAGGLGQGRLGGGGWVGWRGGGGGPARARPLINRVTNDSINQLMPLIRRLLLARGTKAAGAGFIVFLSFYQLAVIAFQAIRLCFSLVRGLRIPHDLPHQIPDSLSVTSLKIVVFSSLLSRPKNQKSSSQGPQQSIKIDSEIHYTRFP